MTTFATPVAGSVRWQEIYKVPPQLRLETVGPWCPLDDSQLRIRMAGRVPQGWDCLVCQAMWDRNGTRSWWPGRARVSPARVAALVAGSAATATGLAVPLAGLDQHLVVAAATVPAAAAIAIVLHAVAGRVADAWRYRHNIVLRRVVDSPAALAGQVVEDTTPSDGQLLLQLGLALRSQPGPALGSRLSTLVEHVCRAHCPASGAAARAEQLETALAAYLHERHVLRFRQVTPAELDTWASTAPLVVLHAAVAACARRHDGAEVPDGH